MAEKLAAIDGEAIAQTLSVLAAGGGTDLERRVYKAAHALEHQARKVDAPQAGPFLLGLFYGIEVSRELET